MFSIVLFQPEIPPNTGNIIRLCANTGSQLHLIEPLGFALDDKKLRRAGLDYQEWAQVKTHPSLDACFETLQADPHRVFACTTKGSRPHSEGHYHAGDVFLFGPETRGLPNQLIEEIPKNQRIRIPMLPSSRSLNLSNAAAVILYEAWRHIGYRVPSEGSSTAR